MLRSTRSALGRHRHYATLTFPDLPGLVIEEDYLDKDLQDAVFQEARAASRLAQQVATSSNRSAMVSPAHNIPIRSEYIPVQLPLEGFDQISTSRSAEHFGKYGEGHRLTYFRGNENIPRLGLPLDFLTRLSARKLIDREVRASRLGRTTTMEEKWRLTLNHYPSGDDGRVGFPWHRDLEANGASTMILGLGSPGRLEFGKEPNLDLSQPPPEDNRVERPDLVEPIQSITLEPGSLMILTGPARWHFVHRVLASGSGKERASLVFGVW